MTGRHAFSAASSNALSDSMVRKAAVALAAGAMFGAALPTAAAPHSGSNSHALAELTTSGDTKNTTVAAEDTVVIASSENEVAANQIVIEDSVAATNVDLSLDVKRSPAPTASNRARTNTAARGNFYNTPAGPLLSDAEAGPLVAYARQFLGTPYVRGGSTPAAFDCSGFTQYVFAHFGISLPRTAAGQGSVGHRISAAEARPGDLVVWGKHHVGIYTGNGNHIAAHKPGVPLSEGHLYGSYYFVRVG